MKVILRTPDLQTGLWFTFNARRRWQIHVYTSDSARIVRYRFHNYHEWHFFKAGYAEAKKHQAGKWGK